MSPVDVEIAHRDEPAGFRESLSAGNAVEGVVECDCALSLYSSRETPELLARAVRTALSGAQSGSAIVDVVVNGNSELANALSRDASLHGCVRRGQRLRVWSVALGDKAAAWNAYLHGLAPQARTYVFIDGYVRIGSGTVDVLTRALAGSPEALAATGWPRSGRTAAQVASMMRSDGGIHGNVYALQSRTLRELRAIGFRLPLGIYRNDSTLGAALSFGLNLFPREWRARERILVLEEATWEIDRQQWWRPSHLAAQHRRRIRQAQGALEIAAVRDRYSVRRLPFEQLPETAIELVEEWLQRAPAEAGKLLASQPLARRALDQLRRPRDWTQKVQPPALCLDHHGDERATAARED